MALKHFTVEGMSCAHCEASVQEEVLEVAGVSAATADHTTGSLDVDGDGFSTDDIAKAVEEAGYTLV